MFKTPIYTSLSLKKAKSLPVPTDFDVYENFYFGTDVETLVSNISDDVNNTLRQGYGLLNDDFEVNPAILNRDHHYPGISITLHFYRPLHFETFCMIGQEHSKFHDEYFKLCASFLSNKISIEKFINSLKQLEITFPTTRALYTQEYLLYTSSQVYDESIPEHIYKEENGIHPYIEMYKNAREEISKRFGKDVQFVSFHPYHPIVNGTLYHQSENHFIVFLNAFKLKKLSVDEALSIYTFDTPDYVCKAFLGFHPDLFYKEFSKLSILYLSSELSTDEFYVKLLALNS